ncbi:polysaccharide pyruvyl transferase family protein [Klebsiella grimontii]|uniref:polysaccharide pyruvyl transferase family protein n=1 Tax=Klebsiella grimontii TaxID=2058152 RepID=UPI00188102D1|nr:polysaccharide pyruvyl transferase family protein [Klebsiella grimontii]MBE8890352.1 polysaccharide pyruvyl transferase family protein [Klebsiella grimontii]
MSKKVVLYGAFDRYNYGDNLMPILLEIYFRQNHPDKVKDVEFLFASIKSSDLSQYSCKKTVAISDLLSIENDSTIIVVGGEVLGADIGVLFTHVQKNHFKVQLIKLLRKIAPSVINAIARKSYGAVWDYPYIPQKRSFTNKVKVIYNTVGGIPSSTQGNYLKEADYISVRDQRTAGAVTRFCNVELIPDSVLMASKLLDISFIESHVRESIKIKYNQNNFITVQACPYKVDFTANELASELLKFPDNINIVLLPIGYASGHDDIAFLDKVYSAAVNKFSIVDDLNVWEIMYLIIKSQAFYGTSLHGVITAMSFGVPHYCINKNISKLTSFLETWSVEPYTQPLQVVDIFNSFNEHDTMNLIALKKSVDKAQSLIFNSLQEVSNLL